MKIRLPFFPSALKLVANSSANPRTGAGGKYDNSASIYSSELPGLYNGASFRKGERQAIYGVYKRDKLLQKSINIPVTDSLITWRDISDEKYRQLDKELKIKQKVMRAGKKARLLGGCLLIPIIVYNQNTPASLTRPLNNLIASKFGSTLEVKNIILVDNYTESVELIKDPLNPRHGKPTHYINEDTSGKIDGSRAIEIKPDCLFFNAVSDYFYKFHAVSDELKRAIEESNRLFLETDFEWVLNIAKSKKSAGIGNKSSDDMILDRVHELRRNANAANVWAYDGNKEKVVIHERKNIAAITGALQKYMEINAAVSDVPVSRFAGTAGGSGLANSTQSDLQNYFMSLSGFRFDLFEEPVIDLGKIFLAIKQIANADFTWNPFIFERFITSIETDQAEVAL